MRALRLALLVTLVGLVPAASWAGTTPGSGMEGTKHDFSGKGTPQTGLCTFCHTPHKALQTPLLWNHTLSTNTFSWDVPTTTAGTTFPTFKGDTYKGPTGKCLSCHDGTVAIGDVAWFNAGKPSNPLDNTQITGARQIATTTGGMAGNHPVAMPFPYNKQASTYNAVTTGSGIVFDEWQADPLALNIRLFNDDGLGNVSAGPIVAKTGIECSSCHDPHNKKSTGDFFLRGTLGGNTTDYICLKCHIK